MRLIVTAFLALGLAGCSTAEYLWQAGRGQLSLMNRAKPLDEVIRDQTTPGEIRALLSEVAKMKKFGEGYGMKPTRNYESYVKLDRDAAVYVVSACHPLKFEPKEWSFPIVGGFPYLGWYTRDSAEKFAASLRDDKLDVDLRGAPAYSTLGWFRDPILSTMIVDGERAVGELAEVVLHESLHATLHIKNQAFFNESLASYVSEGLTPLYLEQTRGKNSDEEKEYREGIAAQTKYYARMHAAYEALNEVYRGTDSDVFKLAKKDKIIEKLKADVKWRSNRPLNNATLLGFGEYGGNREVWDRLFVRCGKNWPRFIKSLQSIRSSDFPENQTKDLSGVEKNFNCG